MATKKQIAANRKNAKKSTGPKTAHGKATVAQNATKHGLTAQKPLIPGEDPDQFAIFNDAMLADLTPQGPLETVLANRIITLTWQLNRAPRLQAAAISYMIDDFVFKPSDPEKLLGKTVASDFANNHVLEKLQNYEQRIENNIYKTLAQLEKIQKIRKISQESQPEPQPTQTTQSTNYELTTTNSSPQNKPNPNPQSTNYELTTTNSFPKNKPNFNTQPTPLHIETNPINHTEEKHKPK